MIRHPFEYVVYGRPASTQPKRRRPGGELKKDAALPRWRSAVRQAFEEAWKTYDKEYLLDSLRLDLVWVYDSRMLDEPDLDNIVKPFIDIPEGTLYESDAAFGEMHLARFELHESRMVNIASETLAEALATEREFVYIRISAVSAESVRALTLSPIGEL
jgi:Holliday junction resolvase RusA-like endonuclease